MSSLGQDAKLQQPGELKFAQLLGRRTLNTRRLELEEHVHDHGGTLHDDDKARKAAWAPFNDGPRALGLPRHQPPFASLSSAMS